MALTTMIIILMIMTETLVIPTKAQVIPTKTLAILTKILVIPTKTLMIPTKTLVTRTNTLVTPTKTLVTLAKFHFFYDAPHLRTRLYLTQNMTLGASNFGEKNCRLNPTTYYDDITTYFTAAPKTRTLRKIKEQLDEQSSLA